jgi:hypothetical protein
MDQLNDAMNEEKGRNQDKWQELYKMAERKRAIDKQNRAKDDIEYLKNPEEYTFQPNSHKYKGKLNLSPKVPKREENTLETVAKGSKTQRDRSQPTTLRGGRRDVSQKS